MRQILSIVLATTVVTAMASTSPDIARIPALAAAKDSARPMMKAADNSDLHQLPIIGTLPEGVEESLWSRDSHFFARDGQGQMYTMRDYGMVSWIAVSDTEVYIKDPFAGWPTGSWLKGERDGDKVSVTFPQMVWSETYPDWENDPMGEQGLTVTDYYYAYKFILQQGDDKSSFTIDGDNPTITFTFDGMTLKEDGDAFIGMVGEYRMNDKDGNPYTGFNWMGFADGMLEFTEVTAAIQEVPPGVEFEKWILDNKGDLTFVDLAFDGEDCWLRGFIQTEDRGGSPTFPAIRGTFKDGQLTFSETQFLGIDPRYGHLAYFVPCTYEPAEPMEEEWDVENIYIPARSIVFRYDADAKVFTCSPDEAIVVSALPDRVFTILALDAPELKWQDMSTPLEPSMPTDLKYAFWEEYEFGALGFTLSPVAADGRLMDTTQLFYTIYIDGEEFTFYPDEYWDLEEPMTEVPYDYWDSYINAFGEEHEVLLFAQKIETLGVKAIYVNPDGSVTESAVAEYSLADVEAIGAVEVVRTEWYDLQGRRLSHPGDGISLRRDISADGKVMVTKTIKPGRR